MRFKYRRDLPKRRGEGIWSGACGGESGPLIGDELNRWGGATLFGGRHNSGRTGTAGEWVSSFSSPSPPPSLNSGPKSAKVGSWEK